MTIKTAVSLIACSHMHSEAVPDDTKNSLNVVPLSLDETPDSHQYLTLKDMISNAIPVTSLIVHRDLIDWRVITAENL